MYRNIINGMLIVHGCIHNLEKECIILNEKVGDCSIDCDDKIVWTCEFFRCDIKEVGKNI